MVKFSASLKYRYWKVQCKISHSHLHMRFKYDTSEFRKFEICTRIREQCIKCIGPIHLTRSLAPPTAKGWIFQLQRVSFQLRGVEPYCSCFRKRVHRSVGNISLRMLVTMQNYHPANEKAVWDLLCRWQRLWWWMSVGAIANTLLFTLIRFWIRYYVLTWI